jgi:hypothetical protein
MACGSNVVAHASKVVAFAPKAIAFGAKVVALPSEAVAPASKAVALTSEALASAVGGASHASWGPPLERVEVAIDAEDDAMVCEADGALAWTQAIAPKDLTIASHEGALAPSGIAQRRE